MVIWESHSDSFLKRKKSGIKGKYEIKEGKLEYRKKLVN